MLVDAHCHPTEDPGTLAALPALPARLLVMATRAEDLELVAGAAGANAIPAFGLHPWWSHRLWVGDGPAPDKAAHYARVLEPPLAAADAEMLAALPEPAPLAALLAQIERLLAAHPAALVGECGLDKAFRVPLRGALSPHRVAMAHQVAVLDAQLALAARLGRRVSLHGVQAPLPLFDAVRAHRLPGVCLHSYSGSPDFLTSRWLRQVGSPVWVSVSVLVNMTTPARAAAILAAVPADRLLTESDFHAAGPRLVELVEQALDAACAHHRWTRAEGEARIEANLRAFLGEAAPAEAAPAEAAQAEAAPAEAAPAAG